MISFLVAVSSKVAVDSIIAGVGLGLSIYSCSRGRSSSVRKRR